MKTGTKNLDKLSKPSRRKLLILITIGFALLVLSVAAAIIDPMLIFVKYKIRLAKGSLFFDILSKEVAGAFVETYIFNITNADKFISGEDYKLKVAEVGPFIYQEYRSHDELFLDEEAGVLRYSPRMHARFVPEKSIADPKSFKVSVPNIPFLAMASKLGKYSLLAQWGFNVLTSNLNSQPVINLSPHDFLWGYNDSLIALGNTLIPGFINFEKLGLLDRLYDKKAEYTLEVGASNTEKFKIKTVNGAGGLRMWGYDNPSKRTRCNSFIDTYEGMAYPPGLTPETPIRLYRNVFCRMLSLQYTGTRDIDFGPKAFVYTFSNETFMKGPETECLCGNLGCMDGMSDLSPCFYGFDVYMSQAHLLNVDPKLYERIEGIHPDYKKHGSEFIVDPKLGSVLTTSFTLQLNVVVENADFNPKTRPFSHIIVPILYFKIIQPELPDDTKSKFRLLYHVLPYVTIGIETGMFIVAVFLLAYSARTVYWNLLESKKCVDLKITKDKKSRPLFVEEPLIERDVRQFTKEVIG